MIVVLNIVNIIEQIIQDFGVIQWDNMAYVVFLILMAAFSEILEDIWEDNGLKKEELQQVSDDDVDKGEGVVKSHTNAQYKLIKGVTFTFF